MADAATQLSLNQTALQAALAGHRRLNKLSLLNYLPVSSSYAADRLRLPGALSRL